MSEVNQPDNLADNVRTMEFLRAGEQILHDFLVPDSVNARSHGRTRPPFEELFSLVSRRRVIAEAARGWRKKSDKNGPIKPTESAFRYRWHSQAGYLRDLLLWSLIPRFRRPDRIDLADLVIDEVVNGERTLGSAVTQIAATEVEALKRDKAFRLQMVFQATLSHDERIADALTRVGRNNLAAWRQFHHRALDRIGLKVWDEASIDILSHALHAVADGIMFQALLPRATPDPADMLGLIANALLLACIDWTGEVATRDQLSEHVRAQLRRVRIP